jgi:hypothetical protein
VKKAYETFGPSKNPIYALWETQSNRIIAKGVECLFKEIMIENIPNLRGK